MDNLQILLLLGLFLIFVVIIFFKAIGSRSRSSSPKICFKSYRLASSLLTPTELSFYSVLSSQIPSGSVLLIKPRIADFVKVAPFDRSLFNRISSKHVDFLICDAANLEPLLAIELDDSSHSRSKVQDRDAFVEELYRKVSLPLCRFKVARSYRSDEVASRIFSFL